MTTAAPAVSRGPIGAEPHLRPGEHLRQDRPRLATRDDHRRRRARARSSSASAAPSPPSSTRRNRGRSSRTSSTPSHPSCRAWPARSSTSGRWAGTSSTSTASSSRSCSRCGRSSPCRARSPARRSAAASSSSPSTGRSRRRIALEKLSGHLLMIGLVVLVVFVAIAYRRQRVRGPARRRDQRRSPPSATRSGSA